MPKSNPSESTREVYQVLQAPYEGVPIILPTDGAQHSFSINMDDLRVEPDEVTMSGDDFPYIRSALINEAIQRGDIKYEMRQFFADDATLTINDKEYPIEDGSVTMER